MHSHNFIDITGNKYGMLLVISYYGKDGGRRSKWLCECDCGRKCVADGYRLRSGKTKSCGCLSRKIAKEKATTHGMSGSKIYHVHNTMNSRCYDKKNIVFRNYGGRGISVCDEWKGSKGFGNFLKWSLENGYKEGLSIDRIDVNGNYEPCNCRWVTQKEQGNNTRTNRILEYNGERHTAMQWSEKLNIPYKRLMKRLYSGWSIEKAFKTPKMKNQFC